MWLSKLWENDCAKSVAFQKQEDSRRLHYVSKSIEHWVNWVNRWHFASTDSGNTCQRLSHGLGPWFFRSLDWVDYLLQSWTLGLVFCLRRFRQSESQSSCATMLRKTYSLGQNQSQTGKWKPRLAVASSTQEWHQIVQIRIPRNRFWEKQPLIRSKLHPYRWLKSWVHGCHDMNYFGQPHI